MATIYKICPIEDWRAAEGAGVFKGAGIDLQDGYIHFSTAAQTAETLALHFAGRADLVLVAVETGRLGAAVKWEKSRGGQLFPHLYGELRANAAIWAKPLPLDDAGKHILPALT